MRPFHVEFHRLRGGGTQRRVQVRPEPAGPAQLGEERLLRAGRPADQAAEGLRGLPDVPGIDVQAGFVRSLQPELQPPAPATGRLDRLRRTVGRHRPGGQDRFGDLVGGRLDQAETGPHRATGRVALPRVQFGGEDGQPGRVDGEVPLWAGERGQPGRCRTTRAQPPAQRGGRQRRPRGSVGQRVERVRDQRGGGQLADGRTGGRHSLALGASLSGGQLAPARTGGRHSLALGASLSGGGGGRRQRGGSGRHDGGSGGGWQGQRQRSRPGGVGAGQQRTPDRLRGHLAGSAGRHPRGSAGRHRRGSAGGHPRGSAGDHCRASAERPVARRRAYTGQDAATGHQVGGEVGQLGEVPQGGPGHRQDAVQGLEQRQGGVRGVHQDGDPPPGQGEPATGRRCDGGADQLG